MNKASLRKTIFSTPQPRRDLVVRYVKLLCEEAKLLPVSDREARGNYQDPAVKFPQTKGEDIASDISSLLAQQIWIDWEHHPDLMEIQSISGGLEIHTTNAEAWRELISKADLLAAPPDRKE